MKVDLIADLWSSVVGHIEEKSRQDVATDFINILVDHGIKDSVLESLVGVDTYLDEPIQYVLDDEEDDDYGYDE